MFAVKKMSVLVCMNGRSNDSCCYVGKTETEQGLSHNFGLGSIDVV